MSQKFKQSQIDGPHFQLTKLIGQWQGTTKTWFDPSKVEDESTITGTIKPILDGRFVMHEYESSFKGDPMTGIAIYGYHLDLQKYQAVWLDSFHNGVAMMFSEGKKEGQNIDVTGSYAYVTPETEQYWGWRTHIEVVSDSEIIISAFNITPEGIESRALETTYKRV